jgi:hypothetical protein
MGGGFYGGLVDGAVRSVSGGGVSVTLSSPGGDIGEKKTPEVVLICEGFRVSRLGVERCGKIREALHIWTESMGDLAEQLVKVCAGFNRAAELACRNNEEVWQRLRQIMEEIGAPVVPSYAKFLPEPLGRQRRKKGKSEDLICVRDFSARADLLPERKLKRKSRIERRFC